MPAGPDVQTDGTVVAVVVTHHRRELLAQSLEVLTTQSRPIDHLVVVDNGDEQDVADLVAAQSIPTTYLGSKHNLGGAGGFALGMLHALALGADWVWCADDDGRPDGPDVLATLLRCAVAGGYDELSPVVVNIDDADTLAFPLRRGLVWRRKRSELFEPGEDTATQEVLDGIASLMNGALFSARAIEAVGVPDMRLFVRGDEVEMHRRLVRSGLRFGTCLVTAYLHPDGTAEFRPILGGRMHTQYPDNDTKRYYTYRNRGWLLHQPGLRRLIPQEYARFGWYFLVQQRDVAGFREWVALRQKGRRELFSRR